MSSKRDFRVVKLCQKLCLDIEEMQGTADKKHKYTICQDVRKKSQLLIHLTRKANDLPAGDEHRIELQEEADELLERIQDLIWVVGKCINTGVRKEAQIELSIENVQKPLHNWMERDQQISASMYEKKVRKQTWVLFQAKKICEAVQKYYNSNPTERNLIALEESKSRYRIAAADYKAAIDSYDKAIKRLRTTQERYHKDDSVLSEVIGEIKEKTDFEIPDIPEIKNGGKNEGKAISTNTISEKKEFIANANRSILEEKKDVYSESTIRKLDPG